MTIPNRGVPLIAPPYIPPILSLVNSLPKADAQEIAEMQKGRSASAGEAWVLGGEFRAIACSGDSEVFPVCDQQAPFGDGELSGLQFVNAFGVMVSDRCSPFGFEVAQYWDRALLKHRVRESFLIAQELWTGSLNPLMDTPNFSFVGNPAVDDITPATTPKPHDALGRIDSAINSGLMGAMGAIHMTIGMFNDVATANGIITVGSPQGSSMLGFTRAGTLVVADAGYPGTAPDGSSDIADEWEYMYATAMPKLYREDAKLYPEAPAPDDPADQARAFRQALNRDSNTVEVRAISAAAVAIDPCKLYAIKATRAGVS